MKKPKIELHKNEQIFAMMQADFKLAFLKMIPWLLGLCLLILLFWPFWQKGMVGILILLTFIIFTLYNVFLIFYRWQYNTLIITDERVIDLYQHGFFNFELSEVPLLKVKSVQVLEGNFYQKALNLKNILIKTEKAIGFDMMVSDLREAEKVAELISELQIVYNNHYKEIND